MKININLVADRPISIPINQNYFLSSIIYKRLSVDEEYASFLHDVGYSSSTGKAFKLFVFSPLRSANRRISGNTITLGPGKIDWNISSPMPEFLTAIATGLLSEGDINICGEILAIESIETAPEPVYSSSMKFTCLSPIVVSRANKAGGTAEYLLHDDPEFAERIRLNLIQKYQLVKNCTPENAVLDLVFDKDYIDRKEGRVTKLIEIKKTKIRGVFAPFVVAGSIELIRMGNECGWGSYGSMGFGFCERI
jgi:CRISPR-associated endoribonuclease Cas6